MINNRGFGLIEVVASLGIATMIITSLVSLSIFTLRSSLKSKLLLEGSKVANREMELIRAYRDKNTWSDFVTAMGSCTSNSNPPSPSCHMGLDAEDVFTGVDPEVSSMPLDGISRGFYSIKVDEVIKINVVIQWKEGALIKKTTLRTDLTNWQDK